MTAAATLDSIYWSIGKRIQYRLIFFWQHSRAKIYSIGPENYDWHGHGVGFDTLKDPKIRESAEAAAKKVNAHLKWRYRLRPRDSAHWPRYSRHI